MATLSTVRDRIKSDLVLGSSTAYDSQIDDAIRSSLRQLKGKKYWFLEATADLTLTSSSYSVSLPSDYAASGWFEIIIGSSRQTDLNGFDFLEFETLRAEYWDQETPSSGAPGACAVSNGTLYVSHTADQDYTIPMVYYKKDATLPTADGDTSVWFDDGYDLLRAWAMLIFKLESKEYDLQERDKALIEFYQNNLDRQHEKYETGA